MKKRLLNMIFRLQPLTWESPWSREATQGLSWASPRAASLLSLLSKHPGLTSTGEKQNKLSEYSWQFPDTIEQHFLMIPTLVICQGVNKAGENAKLTDYRWIHDFVIKDSVLNSSSKDWYNFHILSVPGFGLNSREMWASVRHTGESHILRQNQL